MADYDEQNENRKRGNIPSPVSSRSNKRAKTSPSNEKANRGLCYVAMMVRKMVEQKKRTTYQEVADTLVEQVREQRKIEDSKGADDEKNIRRRVYDALNVCIALDIISRDKKKELTWKGLAAAKRDIQSLKNEVGWRESKLQQKREELKESVVQKVCYQNLVNRNLQDGVDTPTDEKIKVPFFVLAAHPSTSIECQASPGYSEIALKLSSSYELADDNIVLRRMGMNKTPYAELQKMLPAEIMKYCESHHLLDSIYMPSHHAMQQQHAMHRAADPYYRDTPSYNYDLLGP